REPRGTLPARHAVGGGSGRLPWLRRHGRQVGDGLGVVAFVRHGQSSLRRRTARPLDGNRGQASTLDRVRSGFTRMFDHTSHLSVSLNARRNLGTFREFHRISLDAFAATCPHGTMNHAASRRRGKHMYEETCDEEDHQEEHEVEEV
ncbi:MAG: hypothetical protein WBE26_18285, partial [Phycisphaerae bacterium]